ncbi:MAG: imelysin family protein [Pseudomonadota bacterium]
MPRIIATALLLFLPNLSQAADITRIVDEHILPGYETLVAEADGLANAALDDCSPDNETLKAAYHSAFDAWISVSHLRFGPSEEEQRGFALYFWPDTRGATQQTLTKMIVEEDAIVQDAAAFPTVSVAVRGFLALEFLLYDEAMQQVGTPEYRCALLRAIASDMARTTSQILEGWNTGHAELIKSAGENETYRTEQEALRQAFTALTTGLEFTSDARLGRPLGTFDRPRPKRAEARRSDRSLRHVVISLEATRAMAALISDGDTQLDSMFADAVARANALDDPVFAGVANAEGRFAVVELRQDIDAIRQAVAIELGPKLGVEAGFNSLDGD